MTRFVLAVCVVPALLAGATSAQDRAPDELARVVEALLERDAPAVLAVAADRIEIGLLTATRTYTRSQARFVLDRFFDEYPPESISIDRSTGTDQGWYAAASLRHARTGDAARLYLRLRWNGDEWRLRELVLREAPE